MLARGLYATVYKAVDSRFAVNRAIKVLHPDVVEQRPDLWRRMELEAKVMNRLAHPNVVRVYDLVAQNSQLCVVMDLADGGTLADWLVMMGPMPPRHALGFLVQVLSALTTAHINGIVHRDVKPQNILLDRRGVALLSDFGAALHAGPDDDAMAVIGTTGFMAPEQCHHDRPVAAPADLYAVAATLYTLLTTRTPADLGQEPADSPRWAGLTKELVALIRRGMAPEPKDRFTDATEMARAFEEARATAPTVPLAPFEPDHEDFFPYAAEGSAESLGWSTAAAHLPPSNPAIQVALSYLDDPLLFRETEPGASLLAEPTPETGGTLVAVEDDLEGLREPSARDLRRLAPREDSGLDDSRGEDVVGFSTPSSTHRTVAEEAEPVLGYLPDDAEVSDVLPPEASELPEAVLAAQWADRLKARRRSGADLQRPHHRLRVDRTTDAGVRPLRPLDVRGSLPPPEPPPPPTRPAPAIEPRRATTAPRLPFGLLFVLGMVGVVLWAGILLGRGAADAPPPNEYVRQSQASNDFRAAPRPVEVRIQAPPSPKAPDPSPPAKVGAKEAPSSEAAAPTPSPSSKSTGIDPVGRWTGTLGGRQVVVVLRGRPSAFRGTVTSTFLTNSMKTEVAGSYDPESRTLSFEDLDAVPDAGRYWGNLNEDGTRFEGWFERLDGVSRRTLILKRAR